MTSIYIHIPFCRRKCCYCDFFSIPDTGLLEPFLSALFRELSLRAGEVDERPVETVFLGGGTPSLLEPSQLERLLDRLHAAFRISPDAEVTLEANPGTVSEDKLKAFRGLGVNRLSIGIQSFHDRELAFLGRIHNCVEALQSIKDARAAGFGNWGLDLIYAIPGQALPDWEENLTLAVDLDPTHISAYNLTIEPGTPLAGLVERHEVAPASSSVEAAMLEAAMHVLAGHGYEHYEISNYARPGFRCRHNLNYWSHGEYLGLGPSAHSFERAPGQPAGRRWWNTADVSEYIQRLGRGDLPVESEERLGRQELLTERIFLGLRNGCLDLAQLAQDFGYALDARAAPLVGGMAEAGLVRAERDSLALTEKGYLVCDEICRRILGC